MSYSTNKQTNSSVKSSRANKTTRKHKLITLILLPRHHVIVARLCLFLLLLRLSVTSSIVVVVSGVYLTNVLSSTQHHPLLSTVIVDAAPESNALSASLSTLLSTTTTTSVIFEDMLGQQHQKSPQTTTTTGGQLLSLRQILSSAQVVTVQAKLSVEFTCNSSLVTSGSDVTVVWKKLVESRAPVFQDEYPTTKPTPHNQVDEDYEQQQQETEELSLISLNERLVAADRDRYKVSKLGSSLWILSLLSVSAELDDSSYFLCQISDKTKSITKIASATKLQVVSQPQVIDEDDEDSQVESLNDNNNDENIGVQVNEEIPDNMGDIKLKEGKKRKKTTRKNVVLANLGDQATLTCRFGSSSTAANVYRPQIYWRRATNGKPLLASEAIERRVAELDVNKYNNNKQKKRLFVERSELFFAKTTSKSFGSYLCIASNGLQPGVSKLISLELKPSEASFNQTELPTTTIYDMDTYTNPNIPVAISANNNIKPKPDLIKVWQDPSRQAKKFNQGTKVRFGSLANNIPASVDTKQYQKRLQIPSNHKSAIGSASLCAAPSDVVFVVWLASLWFVACGFVGRLH